VKTPARSVTPIVAEADWVLSATLVAVIVNVPATSEEKATDVVVGFASDPPVAVQVTPALPTSFVTVALNTCVCDVVNPPSAGLTETVATSSAMRLTGKDSQDVISATNAKTTVVLTGIISIVPVPQRLNTRVVYRPEPSSGD